MKLFETLTGKEVKVIEFEEQDLSYNYLFKVYGAKCLVKNDRDLPIINMILNNLLFLLLFMPIVWYCQSHIIGFVYFLLSYSIFFGRYMCLNHEYAHTQIFKNKRLGDFITIFLLGQCHYGIPSGSYYINHVIMHHKGANKWGIDLSSTEMYDCKNNLCFIHYWLRRYFPLCFIFDSICVCIRYKRYKIATAYTLSCILWVFLMLYLMIYAQQYSIPCLWTMVIPMFATSIFAAMGGWMQHFFLNPKYPRKWYSYDIINSPANSQGFNQGFHNVHHTLGNLHWTELPSGFNSLLEEYDRDDVMMIQKLDNVQVFLLIILKRYQELAHYLVTTKPGGHDITYCINFIKCHLGPIQQPKKSS